MHTVPVPWEIDERTPVPWQDRYWYIDERGGLFNCDYDRNRETREIVRVLHPAGSPEPIDYEEYVKMVKVSRKEGLSTIDAFIKVRGEGQLTPSWVKKAKKSAPRMFDPDPSAAVVEDDLEYETVSTGKSKKGL